MDLMFLKDYVILVVLAICLCVGYILKHAVPTDSINKFIPLIMGLLGVAVNLWLCSWHATPEVILGGLFSGLASTGLHQVFVKLIKPHDNE